MKIRLLSSISAFLVIVLLIGAFNGHWVIAKNSENDYTGKEYFKGLMFGSGEVGKKVAKQLDKEVIRNANRPENVELINNIVKSIDEKDPQYFNELKSTIESKDPQRLIELMIEGEDYVKSYVTKNQSYYTKAPIESKICSITVCVAAVVLGGYLYVVGVNAVAVQSVAAVTTGVWKYITTYSSSKESPILEEAAVKTIDLLSK